MRFGGDTAESFRDRKVSGFMVRPANETDFLVDSLNRCIYTELRFIVISETINICGLFHFVAVPRYDLNEAVECWKRKVFRVAPVLHPIMRNNFQLEARWFTQIRFQNN
jgi:hypothetical protein